jgi:hypothetical protein
MGNIARGKRLLRSLIPRISRLLDRHIVLAAGDNGLRGGHHECLSTPSNRHLSAPHSTSVADRRRR